MIAVPAPAIVPAFLWVYTGGLLWAVPTLLWILFSLAILSFFRDPPRRIGDGIVSPADGKVVLATQRGRRCRVNIFMNVHNVHVNRAPEAGRVSSVTHIPGGFVPAFRKDSDRNERVVLALETRYGRMKVTQIAGTVARRIVPYLGPGDQVGRGDRIGMIRFGSRVDLEFDLPPGYGLIVSEGDRVRAGSSVIASGRPMR